MAAKRRWSKWPGRTAQELNGVSGVAGLGGIAVGAGGLAFLAGTAAIVLTGVGAVVVVGAVGYAVTRAVPPPMRRPEELVGQTVKLDDLSNVSPAIRTLSIVGRGQAGKTTLRNRLAFDNAPLVRTQEVTAYVVSLQTAPPSYLAVLDGGGERYAQQFRIAEKCDYLCVILDHNKSDSDATVDQKRLSEHEEFLGQIRHYLDETNAPKKIWTEFLINKRDLWEQASAEQQAHLMQFCGNEVTKWRQEKLAQRVDQRPHSNDIPADVAQFMTLLKQSV